MINKSKAQNLAKGVKEALIVNIKNDLSVLGRDDGFASATLSRQICKMGLSNSQDVTKEELLTLLRLMA